MLQVSGRRQGTYVGRYVVCTSYVLGMMTGEILQVGENQKQIENQI